MICDHGKFSWAEMFSSTNGKTSPSLFCGWLSIVAGCLGFIIALCKSTPNEGAIALGFVTAGSTLLGIRRFTDDKVILPKPEDCKNDKLV